MSVHASPLSVTASKLPYERERLEDIGFMTCMTLMLLGNYAQTGHFGGPLAYTPFNVATHLAGPELGGLRYDYRRPKHPYGDKFMLAGGPLRPDLLRAVDDHGRGARTASIRRPATAATTWRPDVAMLPVDALGLPARRRRARRRCSRTAAWPIIRCSPRRRAAASARCPGTSNPPTSPTTSTAARRASASRRPPARPRSGTSSARPSGSPKIIAFEGEFAMCAGHAQELKTQALALQVGKRLRVFFSDNNAGIDDALIGGVVRQEVRRLPAGRPVDVVRLERLHHPRRPRLRPDRRRAARRWRSGTRRIAGR